MALATPERDLNKRLLKNLREDATSYYLVVATLVTCKSRPLGTYVDDAHEIFYDIFLKTARFRGRCIFLTSGRNIKSRAFSAWPDPRVCLCVSLLGLCVWSDVAYRQDSRIVLAGNLSATPCFSGI